MTRAQLNLKLPEDQKEKWRAAVEADSNYESLSHLVRHAVERELARDHPAGQGAAGGGVDAEALADVQATVAENREALAGLQDRVAAIHDATDRAADDRRAKAEVWAVLPESGEGLTPAAIVDAVGGPFEATTVAEHLAAMEADGHVETADGTHYRRVEG